MKIVFPDTIKNGQLGKLHGMYVVNQAILAGHDVVFEKPTRDLFVGKIEIDRHGASSGLLFTCIVDGKRIVIDYADHEHKNWSTQFPKIPYFKFHYNKARHAQFANMFCMGPMMISGDVSAFKSYYDYRTSYRYEPVKTAPILNKQIPRAAALKRRTAVRKELLNRYGNRVDISIEDQRSFWERSKTSPAHVCVPGAHNNLLDRGQLELFGLGVCTISPLLHTSLCGGETPQPDVHYVKCANDYSDLHAKIDMLYADVELAKKIGQNARDLFERTTLPDKFWSITSTAINRFYGDSNA